MRREDEKPREKKKHQQGLFVCYCFSTVPSPSPIEPLSSSLVPSPCCILTGSSPHSPLLLTPSGSRPCRSNIAARTARATSPALFLPHHHPSFAMAASVVGMRSTSMFGGMRCTRALPRIPLPARAWRGEEGRGYECRKDKAAPPARGQVRCARSRSASGLFAFGEDDKRKVRTGIFSQVGLPAKLGASASHAQPLYPHLPPILPLPPSPSEVHQSCPFPHAPFCPASTPLPALEQDKVERQGT